MILRGMKKLILVSAILASCSSDPKPNEKNQFNLDFAPTVEGFPENGKVESDILEMKFKLDGDIEALGYVLHGFECRFENDPEFLSCGMDSFTFTGLEPGKK